MVTPQTDRRAPMPSSPDNTLRNQLDAMIAVGMLMAELGQELEGAMHKTAVDAALSAIAAKLPKERVHLRGYPETPDAADNDDWHTIGFNSCLAEVKTALGIKE